MRCLWCLPALSLLLFVGCPGDEPDPEPEPPDCADTIDISACVPAYPAEFPRIMSETLVPICGVQGGACHGDPGAEGAAGGLVVTDDLDATHARLLDGFVTPGDPECSPITVRTNLDADDEFLMPPGAIPLDDGVLCSIAQWVAAGAPRSP